MTKATVESKSDRHCPDKSWGYEEWIVNNDLYCGKRLHFATRGGQTSLHFHAKKHETMFVQQGIFRIVVIDTETAMKIEHDLFQGESLVIPPNTPHRIIAKSDRSVLIEFSTHHEDSDSYRIEK